MLLDDSAFAGIIAATPLISIDLIVRNDRGEVLLGKRRNRPAMGYWFVPGGRIFKNERSRDALNRIGKGELGIDIPDGVLLGIFDHIYEDNFFAIPGLSTHYVVAGYQIKIAANLSVIRDSQHAELKWWAMDALLLSDKVHPNTKLYFAENPGSGLK